MNYEFLYQKLQKFGITLPDGVQAICVKCNELVQEK